MNTINKTIGIVIRISPFSRTSHMVTWLTRDYGTLVTVVKGALRPKSSFLGQYDLFYTCELLFYSRERGGSHVLRECSPLAHRPALRTDWKAAACASYFCDLVARISPPGESNPALFNLLTDCLHRLELKGADTAILLWFELKALGIAGFSPQLTECPGCNRRIFLRGGRPEFSSARGGMLCPVCAAGSSETILVDPDVLEIMQRWQKAATPEETEDVPSKTRQLLEVGDIIGSFFRYHVQTSIPGRAVVTRILQ